MKRLLYILPILLLPMMAGAQKRVYDPDSIYGYGDVDKYAKLTITLEEWQRYMTDSLRYPEDALLPEPLDSLVRKITLCPSFALSDDNGWGHNCPHYTLSQKLKLCASFDQLDSLANYGQNSMLRLTAFRLMMQKEYKEEATGRILPIVLKMLEDTSEVDVNSYDVYWNEKTSSLALNIATASDLLSPADSAYLDSVVLWTDQFAYNDRFYRIVDENLGREDVYQRVRDLYLKNGTGRLLSYLAWYRNPQDETLLIEALNDYKDHINKECSGGGRLTGKALEAMQYWPSPAFREAIAEYRTTYALCNHFGYKELVMMFYYILQQDPDWSIPFIHETMKLCRRNPHGREMSYQYFTEKLYIAHRMLGNSAYDEIVRQYQSDKQKWAIERAGSLAETYLLQQIQKKH